MCSCSGLFTYNVLRFDYRGLTTGLELHPGSRTATVVERPPDEYADVRDVMIAARDAALVRPHGAHAGLTYQFGLQDQLKVATGLEGVELDQYLVRVHLLLIRLAPANYLQTVGNSAVSFWFPWITTAAPAHLVACTRSGLSFTS